MALSVIVYQSVSVISLLLYSSVIMVIGLVGALYYSNCVLCWFFPLDIFYLNVPGHPFYKFSNGHYIIIIIIIIIIISVADPDPYHLAGSGSVSGNVDVDPGSAKN